MGEEGSGSGVSRAAGVGVPRPGEGGGQDVPPGVRQRWETASAEVSNLVLAAPELYERSLQLVRLTLDALRRECPDLPSLLEVADSAPDKVGEIAESTGHPTAGLRLGLVASVALNMRSREIVEERTLRTRLDRLADARGERRTWVVVEELGDPAQALTRPYRRIDVHIPSGAALVASAEPDETFTRVVYRLRWARLDRASGRLGADETVPEEQHDDRRSWEAAVAEAHRRLASRSRPG